ncbi:hypothetical protein ES703_58284 [subsurface metagenome]
MKNKDLDELEEKWDAISRMPEKGAGSKEAQKKVILAQLGISTLSPEGYNLSEPRLDENFRNYLQTQRAKNNDKRNFWVCVLGVIITAGILVAMILIAIFKD